MWIRSRWTSAVIAVVFTGAWGCSAATPAQKPSLKEPVRSQSELAMGSKRAFWEAMHGNNYEELPRATELLTAAYLQNPLDPDIALLLGHAHLWRIAERSRASQPRATITDELILAERYFLEAVRLRPEDHRLEGWIGTVQLSLATIHADDALKTRGYALLQEGIDRFPSFNYFTAGYALSTALPDEPRFAEAVEDMWRNIEACRGEKVDRSDPQFQAVAANAAGKRACVNSELAPHNTEGFFLNMGDMLVKQNRPDLARKAYANAQASPEYKSWRFAAVLEERLAKADENAAAFRQADKAKRPKMMVESGHACSGCHAR